MSPLPIANITAVTRVCGRRMSSPNMHHSIHRRPSAMHAQSSRSSDFYPCAPWHPARRSPTPKRYRLFSPESAFIDALVMAGLCRAHSASFHMPSVRLARPTVNGSINIRRDHNDTVIAPSQPDYLSDPHSARGDPTSAQWKGSRREDIWRPSPDGRKSGTILEQKRRKQIRMPWLFPSSLEEIYVIRALREALRDRKTSNDVIFEHYRKLPATRIPYLERKTMETLVTRLISVPLRDTVSMLRYLTVIEDMRASKIPVTRREYNQVMSFITRAFKYTTDIEMRSALKVWTESEGQTRTSADIATFNILLDGAIRSRQPQMAASILREIRRRDLKYDRYTWVTLMMYYAHLRDAQQIRQVYQRLVEAGQVVDTVVLNALMTALLHVGDEDGALQVYEFVKRAGAAAEKPRAPTSMSGFLSWRADRAFSRKLKQRTGAKDGIQTCGPDLVTFNLFVHHYCRGGMWERVQRITDDMHTLRHPPGIGIYLSLLKGFASYGRRGSAMSEWSGARLKRVLGTVMDERARATPWDRPTAVWILRAVAVVFMDADMLEKVWKEIEAQWVRQGGKIPEFVVGNYVHLMRMIVMRQPPEAW